MKIFKNKITLIVYGLLGVAFAVMLVTNVIISKKDAGRTASIDLARLTVNAQSSGGESTPVAKCLKIGIRNLNSMEVDTGKDCYHDAPGPDVNEGNVIACHPRCCGSCNEAWCAESTDLVKCYTL
ncbi:hypothetical protein [Mucilaginibacter psychrotolerans]|uniref:Uncharacterized protein n=1 Tax=Mucilaginibacter psychrotolerans TaxID=1524096 RepID=A0A4Y8SBV2_9SPHI|nr:hypothetical protein [Mucilaginibacter psychrotolerans]TFF36131.1 hypothetical protein E2R66_16430 [Mucilaginibacter psychrotolerans]